MYPTSGDTLFSLENKDIVDGSAEVHIIVPNIYGIQQMAFIENS